MTPTRQAPAFQTPALHTRAAFTLAALLLCLQTPLPAEQPTTPAALRKLIVISWDGGADWVIDRLLDEGRLPHLARLAANGVRADYSVTSYPSKTAVGHSSVWTGTWPDVSGISGNWVPLGPAPSGERPEYTILEQRSGFDARSLTAEPLYVTAALADKKVVVLSATQSYPPGPHVERLTAAGKEDNLVSFSGFEHTLASGVLLGPDDLDPAVLIPTEAETSHWTQLPSYRGQPLEARLQVADTHFFFLLFDSTADPVDGFDTVLIRNGSRDAEQATDATVLKPRPAAAADDLNLDTQDFLRRDNFAGWSPPMRVDKGPRWANTFFRLFELTPNAAGFALYQRKVSQLDGHSSDAQLADYLRAYPGFHDDAFSAYSHGLFGAPVFDAGDGSAERRLLEVVAHDTQLLIEGSRFALETWQPDVLFHYSPMTDSAGHLLLGMLDSAMPDYDAERAAALWPVYIRTFQLLDAWLGALQDMALPETVIALVSDHGMDAIHSEVFPNRILQDAGLFRRTDDGRIDLAHTQILAPPWSDFFVVVNDQRWKDGQAMTPNERAAVLERAREAFLDAKDPRTGKHLVWRVFTAEEAPGLGLGGPKGGDLYLDFASGYYPRSVPSDSVVALPRGGGSLGMHGYWPQRRRMHAIFYAAGPGLRAGVEIPGVRHIDIAPTLSHVLGIPPPADATGHLLGSALLMP